MQIKAKSFRSEGKREKPHVLLGPRMTRFSVSTAPAKPGRSNFPLLMIKKVIYVSSVQTMVLTIVTLASQLANLKCDSTM